MCKITAMAFAVMVGYEAGEVISPEHLSNRHRNYDTGTHQC